MKRFGIIFLSVLAILIAAGVAFSWGSKHLISEVFLPRAAERYGLDLAWKSINAGLGSVTISDLRVNIDGLPEVDIRARRVEVSVATSALISGEVDLRRIEVTGIEVRIQSGGRDTFSGLGEYYRRVRRADGGTASVSGESQGAEIELHDGLLVVEDTRGLYVRADGVELRVGGAGHFQGEVASTQVGSNNTARPFVNTGQVRAGGVTRPFEVDEVVVRDPSVRLVLDTRQPEAEELSRIFSQIVGDIRGDNQTEPGRSDISDAATESLVGLAATTLEIRGGHADLLNPTNGNTEITLVELEGQASMTGVNVSGRADPGGGRVRLGLRRVDGVAQAHFGAENLRVGPLADRLSARGLTFDSGSTVDADLAVTRRGDGLEFQGELGASGLTVSGSLIAPNSLENISVRSRIQGTLFPERRAVTIQTGRIWVNNIEATVSGNGSRNEDRYALEVTVRLLPVACQALLEALPDPLSTTISYLDLQGSISGRFSLSIDSENLENTLVDLQLQNNCVATGRGPLDLARFEGPFMHTVHLPEEEDFQFETGPGTGRWTNIGAISPFVVAAVMTTEDGRFFHHNGFNLREIRRALIRDLRAEGPRFGASTISMQLARNLFLTRHRNLARKLQEAVLTWYLEENLEKDQILALYFNVIEFGPRLFGIRRAAMHYFGRTPNDLSPREAVFLMKLLPSPVRRHEATFERGTLSARWEAMIDRVLRIMTDRGYLTRGELLASLNERIVFRDPQGPLPPPRHWRVTMRQSAEFDEIEDPWEQEQEANLAAPSHLFD